MRQQLINHLISAGIVRVTGVMVTYVASILLGPAQAVQLWKGD